jgi:methylase of polypeptide subunit release factors
MNMEQLKKDIQLLIDDFRTNYQRYERELEANTETKLVEPLFNLLGWKKEDFVKRESARRNGKKGFADYAFYIDGRIAFFLEVKKVGLSLEKEADKQVISYALSKRIPFAVSTNFEELKIFCVEQENATQQIFRVFKQPEDYIKNLQNLLLLSKESFEKNLILKEAENEDRLKKRMSIDKILLEDLMHIRKLIADDIEKAYPKKYELNDKEEIVQRIIDRLIFIRRCEDVGMNPENLYLDEIKHLPDNKAYTKLKEIFQKYNEIYNSGLFAVGVDNDCDAIKIDNLIIKNLIGYLYESKDKQYIYNFDWIDADVLGQVYEQYLGKILEQTKSGKAKLKDGQAHRKEQGIYYTPTYIVDYIVRNTLLEALKNKKAKPQDIKILDMACGSGSFLIKAFDYLYNELSNKEGSSQTKLDKQGMYSIKTEILKRNIYGVDLDNKAVEITKLNLLLKASEPNRKLPEEVDLHIKHGNSLIDDEKVDKNAFIWEGDFKEGGFDVVIGNPPYIRVQTIKEKDKMYLINNYVSAKGKFDLYVLFIEKSLKLLKDNGYFSFIIPNKFAQTKYGKGLKEFILKNFTIEKFIDFGDLKVFGGVTTYPCIIVIKKSIPNPNTKGIYVRVKNLPKDIENKIIKNQIHDNYEDDVLKVFKFKQKDLGLELWSFLPSATQDIFDKIKNSSNTKLIDLRERIYEGFITGNNSAFFIKEDEAKKLKIETDMLMPVPKGKNVRRYSIKWDGEFVIFPHMKVMSRVEAVNLSKYPNTQKYLEQNKELLNKRKYVIDAGKKWYEIWNTRDLDWFKQDKIITPNLSAKNNFSVDLKDNKSGKYFFIDHDCYGIILKNKDRENYLYLLGLLNSKLIEFFIKQKSPMFSGGYYKYHTQYLEQIPIVQAKKEIKEKIIELVNKMIFLNKKLNEIGDKNTSETKELNDKIDKLNKQIDELVYNIYGITDEEKKIIEDNLE